MKVPLNISVDKELIERIDKMFEKNKYEYRNKSHMLECLLREVIK